MCVCVVVVAVAVVVVFVVGCFLTFSECSHNSVLKGKSLFSICRYKGSSMYPAEGQALLEQMVRCLVISLPMVFALIRLLALFILA